MEQVPDEIIDELAKLGRDGLYYLVYIANFEALAETGAFLDEDASVTEIVLAEIRRDIEDYKKGLTGD